MPTRLLPRVLCVHPSAPITPSPFVQCALQCYRLVWRFGGREPPLQLQRVLALSPARVGRLPSTRLRTTLLLSKCFTFRPPFGEPGEERVASPLLPVGSCRTAGIEEMGLHRSRQSVVACNRRPRVETAAPLTAACSGSRFSRAMGPPGDQAGDRLGSDGMRGLTPGGKDAPCAAESLPLVTRWQAP
jgi:hypothetical protein